MRDPMFSTGFVIRDNTCVEIFIYAITVHVDLGPIIDPPCDVDVS